jgi:heme/copper-type cytochrome/quinol oxidase subunit 2
MLTGFLIFTTILLCLQVLRVALSNQRVEDPPQEIIKASFWSWQMNYQMVVIIAGLILFAMGALVYFV